MEQQTYLMRNGKYRLFKIGKSIDPHKRLKQLRTANPNIRLLAYGAGLKETELHLKYKDKRISHEWFRLNNKDIIDIIKLLKNEYFVIDSNVDKYLDYRIDFGKYKGIKIINMQTYSDIKYLKWFLKNAKKTKVNHFTHSVFEFWIRHKDNIALEEIHKRTLQH